MKKIFATVLALALAFSFVAPVVTSAQVMAVSFNTNLTVGSRGADVTALQAFLQAKGYFPATQAVTAYFGPLTRSALAAYQSAKGITPAAGYFGPITRAAVTADMATTTPVSTVPGCVAGALFSATTGQPCTSAPVSTVPGCIAGAVYSSTTGAPCTTSTTTPGLTGTEGTLDVRMSPTPTDNSNVRVQNDVPVYGVEFRARIAPVSVQTLDLGVKVSTNSGFTTQENPGTLINTIKVWDGSTVLATVPVNLTTFTRDSNQNYYYRISGLNFMVPQDTTKVLTVSFNTNSIDVDRYVRVSGYNAASVRAVSGNGISSFYDISSFSRQHTFKKPGTSTLTLSAAGNTLRSMNYRSNGQDDLTNVTLGTFNLKSQSGDSTLLSVTTTVTASGTAPSRLALYNGSTLLKEVTVTSGSSTVVFDNLDTTAGATIAGNDTPVTYTVKAAYGSTVTNGSAASTTINTVTYQTPNGNTATASGSNITNVNQYVYNQAAIFTLAGTPTVSITSDQNGKTISAVATFMFNVQALGGNVTLPVGTDFDINFATSAAGIQYDANSVSATVIPNNNISDGSTASVTVTASIASSSLPVAGLYTAYVNSIRWTAGTTTVVQTYGLDDFKAPSAFNNVK